MNAKIQRIKVEISPGGKRDERNIFKTCRQSHEQMMLFQGNGGEGGILPHGFFEKG